MTGEEVSQMRQRITIGIMIVLTFVLQTSLMPLLRLPATPNLLLILTVSAGFMRGRGPGLLTGFFSGLLLDLFYSNLFGFTALVFMYAGYLTGGMYKVFFDEDIKLPMLFAGSCDLVYQLLFYIAAFAVRRRLAFPVYLRSVIIPEVIATVIFTILFYRIYYAVIRGLAAYELEEEQSPWLRR